MTSTRVPHLPPSTAFLVERYLRVADLEVLSAAVARLGRHCADSGPPGSGVQYLQSIHLPTEDTCFCLLRAPSAGAVRDINRRAGFGFDRITAAVLLSPNPGSPTEKDDMS